MAKDNKKILNAIRFKDTLYTTGMEDELAAVLSDSQITRLTEKKAIFGFTEDDGKTEVKKPAPKK
jgi:hypothetical protein